MRQDIPNFRQVILQRSSEEFPTMHLGGVAAWLRTPPDGARKALLARVGVLDFTHALAGPRATHLLADFGAEMIKAERSAAAMTPVDGRRRTPPSGVEADIGSAR